MGYPEIMSMIRDYGRNFKVFSFVGDAAYYYILGCIDTLDALDVLDLEQVSEMTYILKISKEVWEGK